MHRFVFGGIIGTTIQCLVLDTPMLVCNRSAIELGR